MQAAIDGGQGLMTIGLIAGAVLVGLVLILFIISRLYLRASKETSYVRTGVGGQKVIQNGGGLVFPVFHETIPVNMNTLRLDVKRSDQQALITRDRMRVDVTAEFYVRVEPIEQAIAIAAQTLGRRTMEPMELKALIEGKFVDALRSVAAEMSMEEMHEQRTQFVQKVQKVVAEDLAKNGLELESVSLTGLDQTNKDFFNPDNAFDAEGLRKLTEAIELRRKERNDIERDTEVQIQTKNLQTEKQKLEIARDEEYARLEQEREVEIRRAHQKAEIARQQAEKEQEAEQARISAKQLVDNAGITAERSVESERIAKEQLLKQRDVEKLKAIELAEQDRAIAVAEKSKAESEAKAAADTARAAAVKAEEQVATVREVARAERQKQIELVEAAQIAERDLIAVTTQARGEKEAADQKAEAIRTLATAESEAEKIRAEGTAKKYAVDAEGQRALNEAANTLSAEQIALRVRSLIIEHLPQIIRESVKPMEAIDSIKIVQVDGLANGVSPAGQVAGGGSGGQAGQGGNLADQAVAAGLRYRAQAPILDGLLAELGMRGDSLTALAASAQSTPLAADRSAGGMPPARSAATSGEPAGTAPASKRMSVDVQD